jgi:ubiquinone biosynthesis protein COQ9
VIESWLGHVDDISSSAEVRTVMSSSSRLLQLAIPLVKTHGFTRKTLSLFVLSLPTPHAEPLSDTAISSLWGQGDDARRTLITAWQDDARQQMTNIQSPTMREVLHKRLEFNEPVLSYLPEVRQMSSL